MVKMSKLNERQVANNFGWSWVTVKLISGKTMKVYIAGVDSDYETKDAIEEAIYYNADGAKDYAVDAIPFSQIDTIELAKPPKKKIIEAKKRLA